MIVDRPVPYTGLHKRLPYRAALLHTNGGGTDRGSLYGWWTGVAKSGKHIGAHYQITNSGLVERYVDPQWVVYHAYGASEWAFGIETEDDNNPATPWTDNQLASITDVLTLNGVPGVLLSSPDPAHGVGYHQEYPAWNREGHNCPGPVRVHQLQTEIIPALQGADMPVTEADAALIAKTVLTAVLGHSGPNVAVALQQSWGNTVQIVAELAALKAAIGQGGAVVDYPQVQAAAERAVRNVLGSLGGTA